jgi:hypothetical protein
LVPIVPEPLYPLTGLFTGNLLEKKKKENKEVSLVIGLVGYLP